MMNEQECWEKSWNEERGYCWREVISSGGVLAFIQKIRGYDHECLIITLDVTVPCMRGAPAMFLTGY
jgi:hypothetical protein